MAGPARETRLARGPRAAAIVSISGRRKGGLGDALLTYEEDALYGLKTGLLEAEVVYPRSTILAEVCLVVLDRNVKPEAERAVQAFAAFLWSARAQQVLVEHGFRGSVPAAQSARAGHEFPPIADAFRIEDLGGWRRVRGEILDGCWRRVQREVAKSPSTRE